jgi:hypothetical protein
MFIEDAMNLDKACVQFITPRHMDRMTTEWNGGSRFLFGFRFCIVQPFMDLEINFKSFVKASVTNPRSFYFGEKNLSL